MILFDRLTKWVKPPVLTTGEYPVLKTISLIPKVERLTENCPSPLKLKLFQGYSEIPMRIIKIRWRRSVQPPSPVRLVFVCWGGCYSRRPLVLPREDKIATSRNHSPLNRFARSLNTITPLSVVPSTGLSQLSPLSSSVMITSPPKERSKLRYLLPTTERL